MADLLPGDFTLGTKIPADAQRTSYGKTYDFDFATFQFVDDGAGSVAVLDGRVSLQQSAYKSMGTRRYEDLVYPNDYGSSAWYVRDEDATTQDRLEILMGHYMTDALLTDERIESVSITVDEVNQAAAWGGNTTVWNSTALFWNNGDLLVTGTVRDTFGRTTDVTCVFG